MCHPACYLRLQPSSHSKFFQHFPCCFNRWGIVNVHAYACISCTRHIHTHLNVCAHTHKSHACTYSHKRTNSTRPHAHTRTRVHFNMDLHTRIMQMLAGAQDLGIDDEALMHVTDSIMLLLQHDEGMLPFSFEEGQRLLEIPSQYGTRLYMQWSLHLTQAYLLLAHTHAHVHTYIRAWIYQYIGEQILPIMHAHTISGTSYHTLIHSCIYKATQ